MVVQKNGELKITAEHIIDEAYKKGWEEACDAHDLYTREEVDAKYEEAHDKGYQRGLDDAWDAVRKMERYLFSSCLRDIFGDKDFYTVITRMSASEAIAILEDYEKKETKKRFCNFIQKPCPYEIECDECEVQCSYDRACKKAEVQE